MLEKAEEKVNIKSRRQRKHSDMPDVGPCKRLWLIDKPTERTHDLVVSAVSHQKQQVEAQNPYHSFILVS